ncbi:MAG: hypothetical protein V1826_00510 [bacterium]
MKDFPATCLELVNDYDEASWEEIAALRDSFVDKVVYAIQEHIFTPEYGQMWIDGFDACVKQEHRENLMDLIDDFIASGQEALAIIQEALATDLLNEKEKWEHWTEAMLLSYKAQLLKGEELLKLIDDLRKLRTQFVKVQSDRRISPKQKAALASEFASANSEHKERVIQKAARAASEETRREIERDFAKYKIDQAISRGDFSGARAIWIGAMNHFSDNAERLAVEQKISRAECASLRADLAIDKSFSS